MKKNKIAQIAVLALSVFLAAPSIPTVDAKGSTSSSRSSFSSSSRSSGSSWGSKSTTKSTSWGSKSTTKSSSSKGSSWGSKSTSTKSTSALTPAQQKARTEYAKAKASGKAFTSREAAVKDFKAKNADKYPSTFAKKPETRPDYIPEKTTVGGNTYNVTYNQDRGGYGYMNSLGTWVMFDALADAATMSMLMDRQNYYIGSAPALGTTTVVHRGTNSFPLVSVIIFLIFVSVIIFLIFKD